MYCEAYWLCIYGYCSVISQVVPCTPYTATHLCQTLGPSSHVWARGQAAPSPLATTNSSSLGEGITRTRSSLQWCAGMLTEAFWQRSAFYQWECRTTAVWHWWSPIRTYRKLHLLQRANDTALMKRTFFVQNESKQLFFCIYYHAHFNLSTIRSQSSCITLSGISFSTVQTCETELRICISNLISIRTPFYCWAVKTLHIVARQEI